jgi:trigger factor
MPSLKERSRPEAIDRIKRTLALGEVAKLENLKIDEEVLSLKVKETLTELSGENIDPNRLREVLTEEMLKETILTWLESNWTIELVAEGTLTPAEKASDEDATDDAIEVKAEVA